MKITRFLMAALRSFLAKIAARSKWSRRGRRMRRILLIALKMFSIFVAIVRLAGCLFEKS